MDFIYEAALHFVLSKLNTVELHNTHPHIFSF